MTKMLEARDIRYVYPDGNLVLENINFQVNRGEFIGILGGNGSGKTTLLKLLNGLFKPTQGDVFLEGRSLKSIKKEELFSRVCTCFQNPDDQLFSSTVGQDISFGPKNMGLGKEAVQKRVDYALCSVGMPEFADKAISALSYGQKKKICLAGVLAMGPEIILLDEPTASLDPMAVSSIMRLLKELNTQQEVTMIMTTHSVDLVPLFIDRALILYNGKIINQGSPKEVFLDTALLRSAGLRLPQIGHLFEILKKKDFMHTLPMALTIGQAREEIKNLLCR